MRWIHVAIVALFLPLVALLGFALVDLAGESYLAGWFVAAGVCGLVGAILLAEYASK